MIDLERIKLLKTLIQTQNHNPIDNLFERYVEILRQFEFHLISLTLSITRLMRCLEVKIYDPNEFCIIKNFCSLIWAK